MDTSDSAAQDRFTAPFDLTRVATAVLDSNGVIIGWTRAAEQVLGYSADEVLRRPAARLLADRGDARQAAAVVQGTGTAQEGWGGLVAVRHRDGRRLQLGLWTWPMLDRSGARGWLVAVVDTGETPWWQVNRAMLELFLTRSPVGMAVMNRDLRCIWLNDALERTGGVPREERLGKRLGEVLPGLDTEAIEARIQQVLTTGQPLVDFEFRGHTPADPDRERAFSTSFFRLDDVSNRPLGVCYMVIDVTDRWRARERLALLNEAGARTSGTLDILGTAQQLAEISVPRLADFVSVDLVDSVLRGESPRPGPFSGVPEVRRAGVHSTLAGSPEAVAWPGDVVGYPSTSPGARCLVDGKSYLEPVLDLETSSWLRQDPARAESIRDYDLHSLIAVPIRARGVTLGVAHFLRRHNPEPFVQDDLLLAEEVVARTAVNIDNARRFTREHTTALALQRDLLPHELPVRPTLEVAWRYLPADVSDGVGGDWFDLIPLSGARTALVVGDVVGHGINAAATMGRFRTAVRTLADMDLPPDELLAHLDDLVIRLSEEEPSEPQSQPSAVVGATCLYLVHDPVTGRCTMARAGHLPPAIVAPDGSVTYPELPPGPPLGLGGLPFESAEFELAEGSVVVLYTDGLVETPERDVDVGLDMLTRALADPGCPLEELCAGVLDALLTGPPDDDIALLLARTRLLGEDAVAEWDLPTEPAVVSVARNRAADQLAAWGLEELVSTTELIVSELVTNAIRHASGPLRLRLIRESVLICEVFDASSTSPHLRHARTTDEGGRGLFLVAQLARSWGTRYTPEGKIIWAEQELPEPHPAVAPAT